MATSRRTSVWLWSAGVLVPGAIAAAAALALWRPESRLEQLRGALETIGPTVGLGILALTVGAATLSILPPRALRWLSPGTAAGVGVAVTALFVALSHQLGNALVAGPIVLLASVIIIVVRVGAAVRASDRGLLDWIRGLRPTRASSLWPDLVLLAIVAALGFTVARFGLTSWTMLINDFQRYASSAVVWMSDAGVGPDFASQHPDSYGAGAIARAGFEKPVATGLLVAAHQATGLAPYRLLTPLVLLLLWITACATAQAIRSKFDLGATASVLLVAPATLSVLPISRIMDAQLGQVLGAATLATALALAATHVPPSRRTEVVWGVALGALLASALGSNFTVVLSLAPLVAVLLLWLRPIVSWRLIVTATLSLVVLSVAFAPGFARSFAAQTTGESGIPVAFPSVLAAVGLQPALTASVLNLASWVPPLALAVLALVLVARRDGNARWALVVLGVAVASLGFLVAAYGADSYSTHKWLASALPLLVPLLGAYAIAALGPMRRRTTALVAGAGIVVAATSLYVASDYSYDIWRVVDRDLVALQHDPRLADVPTLNIDLDNQYLDSIAPLVVPSARVYVAAATYAYPSAPVGNLFLIPTDRARASDNVEELNATYSLVRRDLTRGPGAIDFSQSSPDSANLLYGAWAAADSDGTPNQRGRSIIVIDPTGALAGHDVRVTIVGNTAAGGDEARPATLTANGETVATLTPIQGGPTVVSFVVAWSQIEAASGRLTLELTASGATPGTGSPRWLPFTLSSVQLEAVTSDQGRS